MADFKDSLTFERPLEEIEMGMMIGKKARVPRMCPESGNNDDQKIEMMGVGGESDDIVMMVMVMVVDVTLGGNGGSGKAADH